MEILLSRLPEDFALGEVRVHRQHQFGPLGGRVWGVVMSVCGLCSD